MQKTMKKTMQKKNRKGFTLVELIVVIAILAVLAAAAIAGYAGVTGNAKASQAKSNAATIVTALNNYNAITGGNAVTAKPAIVGTGSASATWNLSVRTDGALSTPGVMTATVPTVTAANAVKGPVDMELMVTMTAAEWGDALAYINAGSKVWTVLETAASAPAAT